MLSRFLEARPGLYVQPRMGMASLQEMQEGLKAVKGLNIPAIGTITLDSYTRMGQLEEAQKALQAGLDLNGFPVLSYSSQEIIENLCTVADKDFLIQVRHGTASPVNLFKHLVECTLFLTEGGPVSYCLPYSQLSLKEAIDSWRQACLILGEYPQQSHLESFAGCLLGQLCHPTILVALGILEALFFQKNGLKDISLSYAQHYNLSQDLAAVAALKRLANIYISHEISWHIVIYTFMGLFPQTVKGYNGIVEESVQLATHAGARRLIVKTQEESTQISTLSANLSALKQAHELYNSSPSFEMSEDKEEEELIFEQAKAIIDAVLNLSSEIETSLYKAFQAGYLDVPYCLHPDNRRLASCAIDKEGYMQWISIGKLPIPIQSGRLYPFSFHTLTSKEFLQMLAFNRMKFDSPQET
ncbi:MAG: methylaspartate mutase [Alphaproteobacteria bacterium]|nr:methylaspartate mutase [Alphaproteobacteria bacterium]